MVSKLCFWMGSDSYSDITKFPVKFEGIKQKTGNAVIVGERRGENKSTVQNSKHKVDRGRERMTTPFAFNIEMSIRTGLRHSLILSPDLHKHLTTVPHLLQLLSFGNTTGKAQSLPRLLFNKSSKGSSTCSHGHPLSVCL